MAAMKNRSLITSTHNASVREVLQFRKRRQRERSGRFVIEGVRELLRAVEAGVVLKQIFVCGDLLGEHFSVVRGAANERGIDVTETTVQVFERMAYRQNPDGVLGIAETFSLQLARLPVPEHSLWLIAVGVEKPGNLGAMLRTADAAGVHGVVVVDGVTDLFNPNVVRASVGTLFTVPVALANRDQARSWLAEHGITPIATSPAASVDYDQADYTGNVAVVVGAEHDGLDETWLAQDSVRIPMQGQADSINAGMAATVMLFEAQRQRRR